MNLDVVFDAARPGTSFSEAASAPTDVSGYVRRDPAGHRLHLMVEGVHCGRCVRRIERALMADPAVVSARVNLTTRRLAVTWGGPEAIAAISGQNAVSAAAASRDVAAAAPPPSGSFGEMLSQGLAQIETRLDRANDLVRAYAVDDSVPIHEVTIALEEARIGVELAMEVRNRLVEGYREIMNMQI